MQAYPTPHVPTNTGGVYIPPRVAPTIRNLDAGEPGSATNPLQVQAGQFFKHRIVCYGCPEAAIVSPNKPAWLSIGFGGPGPLTAIDTNTPFNMWYSAEGGTCDGQWIHGTPTLAQAGTYTFTVWAVNGMNPSSPSYTFHLQVLGLPGAPVITSVPADALSVTGPSQSVTRHIYLRPGQYWGYQVQTTGSPAPVITVTGLPAWLFFAGDLISGVPTLADVNTTSVITVTATNSNPPPATQTFTVHVLPPLPTSPAIADVNGDSVVNVLDIQIVVNTILAAPVTGGPYVTDVNGDAQTNVNDVQALVNWVLVR